MFITVEGIDGAGKTTFMEKLAAFFIERGEKVLCTREPGGTSVGKAIRSLVLQEEMTSKTELFLFLADRVEHIEKVIQPALKEKKIVLSDRYNDSTIVYQGAGRGLGMDWVENLCLEACGDCIPDKTFFLDIPPERAQERLTQQKDRLEKEDVTFYQRIREGFLSLVQRHERIILLDALQSPRAVFEQAMDRIQ